MALVIGRLCGEGLLIGDDVLTVVEITGAESCVVSTEDGREFHLGEDEQVEIFPEVFVSCGLEAERGIAIRLVVDAPRTIPIIRLEAEDDYEDYTEYDEAEESEGV